jgi:hypothetical protein
VKPFRVLIYFAFFLFISTLTSCVTNTGPIPPARPGLKPLSEPLGTFRVEGTVHISAPAKETVRITMVLSTPEKRDIWKVLRMYTGQTSIPFSIEVPPDYFRLESLLKVSVVSSGYVKDTYYAPGNSYHLVPITQKRKAAQIPLDNYLITLDPISLIPDPSALSWEEQVAFARERAREIAVELTDPAMSDAQKELILHDYLAANSRWSEETEERGIPYHAHNAYGVLIEGEGVCSAYAEAMAFLLLAAGLEAHIVYGSGHAWNIVRIDNAFYHLDPGWNDSIAVNEKTGTFSHRFYNLSDSQALGFGYSWDREKYPACSLD